ncbi:MAG: DUF3108 domain-containing protein [Bacteroidia bacterium]|nr:DUF3108 domain-containing protein [Bacteroidia bacterium]
MRIKLLPILIISGIYVHAQVCNLENNTFQPGEEICYVVAYNWGFIWNDVGEVNFSISNDTIGNKPVYHIDAKGITYPGWDWFFKVRDRYESWIDPVTVKPYKFKRHTDEGGFIIDEYNIFNRKKNVAYTTYRIKQNPFESDTLSISSCIYDLVSVFYAVRAMDFSQLNPNDTISIMLLLDNKLETVYFRYKGKEKFQLRKGGTYDCVRFSGYLVNGSVFEGGEDLEIWVTDDENRIPVWITAPIIVGSIKARLVDVKGLKNKMMTADAE